MFTSVHIEEHESGIRDTKFMPKKSLEIFQRKQESLRNLDESGIVYVEVEVNQGQLVEK